MLSQAQAFADCGFCYARMHALIFMRTKAQESAGKSEECRKRGVN